MEYELSAELNEQSKAVVISTKVKITAKDDESVKEEIIESLIRHSVKAAIREYQELRPFADAQTLRKQG